MKVITMLLERGTYFRDSVDIIGTLYVNDLPVGRTLETTKRRLPPGVYQVDYCDSPKFKRRLPLIYNSTFGPERGFRIHVGNTVKDTEGCILLGSDVNSRKDNTHCLTKSTEAVNRLCSIFDLLPSKEQCKIVLVIV